MTVDKTLNRFGPTFHLHCERWQNIHSIKALIAGLTPEHVQQDPIRTASTTKETLEKHPFCAIMAV